MGIAAGLVFGKPLGIFVASWLAIKTKVATLPKGVNFNMIYGVAMLAGIGFTMSLFIGTLAFPTGDTHVMVKTGVFVGSIISAVAGYAVLRSVVTSHPSETTAVVEKKVRKPKLPR